MKQGRAVLGVNVPCDRSAPSIVREALRDVKGLGWVLGDLMLVASELVTNAVIHSGGDIDDLIEVRLWRRGEGLLISVHDPGISGKRAAVVERDELGTGGLGLRVVDGIASRWGSERPNGYRVWAELPLTR